MAVKTNRRIQYLILGYGILLLGLTAFQIGIIRSYYDDGLQVEDLVDFSGKAISVGQYRTKGRRSKAVVSFRLANHPQFFKISKYKIVDPDVLEDHLKYNGKVEVATSERQLAIAKRETFKDKFLNAIMKHRGDLEVYRLKIDGQELINPLDYMAYDKKRRYHNLIIGSMMLIFGIPCILGAIYFELYDTV